MVRGEGMIEMGVLGLWFDFFGVVLLGLFGGVGMGKGGGDITLKAGIAVHGITFLLGRDEVPDALLRIEVAVQFVAWLMIVVGFALQICAAT